MLYIVECSYTDPSTEAEWNAYYSNEKLAALLSVGGFRTSQRFRSMTPGVPTYLAMHTVASAEILQEEEYRLHGGGGFGEWQAMITDWRRNVFEGVEDAPAVRHGEMLLISDVGAEPLLELGNEVSHLRSVALDRRPLERWLAVAHRISETRIGQAERGGLAVYRRITAQTVP